MKKVFRGIWKPILIVLPFALGLTGFLIDGEPLLQAFYAGLCLYGMGQKELPPNILVEVARWLAPLVSASAVVMAAKSIRRYFHDTSARMSAHSVAVHGPKAEKEAILKALGSQGIDMEDKPVKASRYLLLGDEMKNLEYFHTYLADTDKDVFLQSKSLSSRSVSKPNLYLFCPEETAARVFWEEHLLYPLSEKHDHQITIAMIGFGSLGRELLLYSLENHIFHPNQCIAFHIWGEENGFRKIYRQLYQISDPVVFHSEPWQDSLDKLSNAQMIIVAQQEDQLATLRDLTMALWNKPIHVMSVQPEGVEILGGPLISFDWKAEAMQPKNIFNEEQLIYAKQLNLMYYDMFSPSHRDNKRADEAWTETNASSRESILKTTEYHRIQQLLMHGKEMTEENVELLAELDHIHWCRYFYLRNWTGGEPRNGRNKDMENRIHRCLMPYHDLSMEFKESCRDNVLRLFKLDKKDVTWW